MIALEEVKKWFENWTKLKVTLHLSEKIIYFKEREIWWASIGANVGFEQNGKNKNYERPVLVIRKFNKDMLWIAPLTSKSKTGTYYFPINTGAVILSQLRLISSKRLIRKVGIISPSLAEKLKQQLKELIK